MTRMLLWLGSSGTVVLGIAFVLSEKPAVAQTAHECATKVQTIDWLNRRQQAIQLAREINTLEQRAGTFVPFAQLVGLIMPADFTVQLQGTQQAGRVEYIFSVKDLRDSCNVFFSDQRGTIYAGQPVSN